MSTKDIIKKMNTFIRQWSKHESGVVTFPSGVRIRGRPIRYYKTSENLPDRILILSSFHPRHPAETEVHWIKWPDFCLPVNKLEAHHVLELTLERAAHSRVDIACRGGVGRTGTALACIAILDGMDPASALKLIRDTYHPRAAETPWQQWYISNFSSTTTTP